MAIFSKNLWSHLAWPHLTFSKGSVESQEDEAEEPPKMPIHADQEELKRALEAINLYRSLSGLKPVALDQNCMKACALVSSVFLTSGPKVNMCFASFVSKFSGRSGSVRDRDRFGIRSGQFRTKSFMSQRF